MKIESRDDLILVQSLCDAAVRANGLNTNPRVYKLAKETQEAIALMPEVPMPMEPQKETVNEKNGKRL